MPPRRSRSNRSGSSRASRRSRSSQREQRFHAHDPRNALGMPHGSVWDVVGNASLHYPGTRPIHGAAAARRAAMLAARENSPEENVSAWSAPVNAAMNAYRQGAAVEWPSARSRPIDYQASSRPVEPTNDLTDMINAVPITEAALNSMLNPHRPKRERLNDLPVAYELSREGAVPPLRARPPENELFLSYREHAPRLHVNRRYSRNAERQRKGRSRSRSETRRPRSPH